jgi:YhcH/YjgK/YiaL family protein
LLPGLAEAFGFLQQADLETLPEGRHEIAGDRVYATVMRSSGRSRGIARLELHRRYADVQLVLSGADTMGWKSRGLCSQPDGVYDEGADIEFYCDRPETWVTVRPREFALFFPADAHAPLVSEGEIYKVVVKVAVPQEVEAA